MQLLHVKIKGFFLSWSGLLNSRSAGTCLHSNTQKMVSFFVMGNRLAFSLRSPPFPSFLNSLSWSPPSQGRFRVWPPPPPGARAGCCPLPQPRPSLQAAAGRQGPPPHTGSQWRLGPAPPLPPRPQRAWARAVGREPPALLVGFGGRMIGRPAAWPREAMDSQGLKVSGLDVAACCRRGMARGRGARGARGPTGRGRGVSRCPLPSPAGCPGLGRRPVVYVTCSLSLRRPRVGTFGSGSPPHALLPNGRYGACPVLLAVFTFTFAPCLLTRFSVTL